MSKIEKILLVNIIAYIVLFIPTNFLNLFDIYTGWGVVLITKDLRMLLLPLNYYLFIGRDKIFWLFLGLVISCIPTDIATVLRITILYEIFYIVKIVLATFLGIEIFKKIKVVYAEYIK